MKQLAYYFCIILWVTLSSCSQNGNKSEAMAYDESMESVGLADLPPQSEPQSKETGISENNTSLQRKIIKEGAIRFETSNAAKTREAILKSVKENNGYLASDNSSNYSQSTDYNITIRVPAERFDTLLEQISNSAKKIDSKEIKALDVTEEFIDVQARINTKKELEIRYREILKQAHKVEDILNIENEIGTLRSDIESLEGRMRYLNDKVSYSTLAVTFYEKDETTSSHSFGFGDKLIEAIHNGWISILWFIIGLVNIWPFILIFVVAFLIIKQVRRNHKKNKNKDKIEFPPIK